MKFALVGTCGIKLESIVWWDFRQERTGKSPIITLFFQGVEPAQFRDEEALRLHAYLINATASKPLPNLIGSVVSGQPQKKPVAWVNGEAIYSERDPVADELGVEP